MEAIEALNYAIFGLNTLKEPQASAKSDVDELEAKHEEIAATLATLRQEIRERTGIDAPELIVLRNEDGEFAGLKCPGCEQENISVVEVDVDERWNTAEPEVDGDRLILGYHRGDCEYNHLRYQCAECYTTVALPAEFADNVDEDWG